MMNIFSMGMDVNLWRPEDRLVCRRETSRGVPVLAPPPVTVFTLHGKGTLQMKLRFWQQWKTNTTRYIESHATPTKNILCCFLKPRPPCHKSEWPPAWPVVWPQHDQHIRDDSFSTVVALSGSTRTSAVVLLPEHFQCLLQTRLSADLRVGSQNSCSRCCRHVISGSRWEEGRTSVVAILGPLFCS